MTSGEVEFLDPDEGSSGPGADPSIPPHGRPPKGSRRLRIDLAVGAVLMLGLFLVARAISHHPAHSATPAASSSVASATSSGATPGS
ncbi:MAG: hypothetical protein J0H43_11085, partial [Actinobacteria bacterium]|nr:hypothetical protein [Actinomycetota bacterium]